LRPSVSLRSRGTVGTLSTLSALRAVIALRSGGSEGSRHPLQSRPSGRPRDLRGRTRGTRGSCGTGRAGFARGASGTRCTGRAGGSDQRRWRSPGSGRLGAVDRFGSCVDVEIAIDTEPGGRRAGPRSHRLSVRSGGSGFGMSGFSGASTKVRLLIASWMFQT
jgi:hypothetical protein